MEEWNQEVLEKVQKKTEINHSTIIEVANARFNAMLPYSNHWAEAMKIGAKPENIATTASTVWKTADLIMTHAGENYNPVMYHPRRAVISSLIVTIEALIAQNPSKSEDYLKFFAATLSQISRGEKTLEQIVEINRFFIEANLSMALSFYPQPIQHLNPMPGAKELWESKDAPSTLDRILEINRFFLDAHWSMLMSFARQPNTHLNPIPGSEHLKYEGGIVGEAIQFQKFLLGIGWNIISGVVPSGSRY